MYITCIIIITIIVNKVITCFLQTAENAMCILRNLSYRLEYEVDPLEGAQDHLDEGWERQVLAEIDDNRREEGEEQPRGR